MLSLKPHVELKHIMFYTVGLLRPYLVKRGQLTKYQFCRRSKRHIKLPSVLQMNYLRYKNYHYHFDSSRSSFASPVKLMFCGLSGATRVLHPPTVVCLPPILELLYQETSMHHSPQTATVTYALILSPSAPLNSLQINWLLNEGGGGERR
jgi:hypothetical protein